MDHGTSVPLAKCSFGMIPLSRHSVDRSPRVFHSSTHNVVRASCFEVLHAFVEPRKLIAFAYFHRRSGVHGRSMHVAGPARFNTVSAIVPSPSHKSNNILGRRDTSQSHTEVSNSGLALTIMSFNDTVTARSKVCAR